MFGRTVPARSRRWGAGMINEDASYYQARAEAEIELARQSTTPQAVQAHYDLSAAYLELVWGSMDHVGRSRAE